MQRRTFLQTMSAAAAVSALPTGVRAAAAGLNLKITDIVPRKIKLVRELVAPSERGKSAQAVGRVGGQSFIEIRTDQGLTGIGPGVTPAALARAKHLLVGKDPMLIDEHAYNLYDPEGGGANIEIALWDLIGKAVNQPLWKLWGGHDNRLMPYASQHSNDGSPYQTSAGNTPEEGARMAETVKSNGWRAIKFHNHFLTMKEDIAFVEQVRKVVGPDLRIMVDVNQAGNFPDGWSGLWARWDLRRALETAQEFHRLGVFWLEEPLPRWSFDQLAEVTASTPMMTAAGEGSRSLHEWAWMLDKKSVDVMQFEIALIGPTIGRQVATLAAAHNAYAVPHVASGLAQICAGHLAASISNAPRLVDDYPNGSTWEVFYLPPGEDLFQEWEVFENPLTMDKAAGVIALTDAPGLGMAYKADLIQDV